MIFRGALLRFLQHLIFNLGELDGDRHLTTSLRTQTRRTLSSRRISAALANQLAPLPLPPAVQALAAE